MTAADHWMVPPVIPRRPAKRHPARLLIWSPRGTVQAQSLGGGYLAIIGRICPEKRPDLAIEIARRAAPRQCADRRDAVIV